MTLVLSGTPTEHLKELSGTMNTNSKNSHTLFVSAYKHCCTENAKNFGIMRCKKKRVAFTLAETMITLIIIGVLAVLTIPSLMQQIEDQTIKNQRIAAASKLARGFAQMRVAGVLEEQYSDTAEFVEQMKNYFQISQICDSSNLTKCFSSKVITQTTENNITITHENYIDEMADKENVMGIKFADGTRMLIKYNPKSPLAGNQWADAIIDKGKIGQLTAKDSYPTYGDLFYYMVDVNSTQKPNVKNKDIIGNLQIIKQAPASPTLTAQNEADTNDNYENDVLAENQQTEPADTTSDGKESNSLSLSDIIMMLLGLIFNNK